MKISQRTVVFITLLSGLLWGCRKPAAPEVSGTYAHHDMFGSEYALCLHTNGSYEDVLSMVEGKAIGSRTNDTGTWTFHPAQSLVVLTDKRLQPLAYAFDDRGTQASLVRTSTPAMPMPITTMQDGTNVVVVKPLEQQPFYRRP
jgi:hypothetical protein